jgi:predicted O-methyltransferase YrrM
MTAQTVLLQNELRQYMCSVSLREPRPLTALRAATARLPNSNMQAAPEVAQLLRLLISLIGARRAIEIGVFTGYSSLAMALALPSDGYLLACDIDGSPGEMATAAWRSADVLHKIDYKVAPALITLDHALASGGAGTFDFVFIDADKENYAAYYERALALTRTNGLIAIDNTLWDGNVINESDTSAATAAIRAFNLSLLHDERIELSLVPISDGLTIARKR